MTATLRALREARWTVLAFAVAGFAMTALQSAAFFRMAGHTFAEHAAFGYALSLQAVAEAILVPPPVRPETVAGYVQMRAFEPLAILFAAWAVVSATGSTSRQVVARASAFAISVIIAAAAAGVGVVVGVKSGGESVGGLGLVETGLLLVALAISCYALCLIVAQITPHATVFAAGLLIALFFLNGLSRVFTQQLAAARWLSPFRYYDLSTPLPQGGRFDVGGFATLLAIALLATAVAVVVSRRRASAATTVNGSAKTQPITYEPSRVSVLAFPIIRDLYPHRVALVAWSLAFAALGVVLVAAARTSMQDLLALQRGLPGLAQYIFVFYAQVLGETWFDVALLMLAALVFAFVARWAADDRDGRLEAALSAPYSRSAVVLERLASLAFTTAVLAALSGLAVAFTSPALNLVLDWSHLATACLLLVLFSVVLGAAGSFLTSSVPRAAPALLGALLLASYLADQIGGPLGVPGWVQDVSPFRLAGDPMSNGVDGGSVALLLLLTLALSGSSILAMQRRDVGA
jgi:polyether ionophore transport system permease protein